MLDRRPLGVSLIAVCLGAALMLGTPALLTSGCTAAPEPLTVSREALGTIVTIEAYGEDDAEVRAAVDAAFSAIAVVESELDAYSPASTIAAVNASPFEWHSLPESAIEVLDAVDRLGVGDAFSPSLLGIVSLYDFGGTGHVPSDGELSAAVTAASGLVREGDRACFAGISSSTARPGFDFGGAAKGLALDRAREALRHAGAVTAALVSAGSTTVTLGTKPDGRPWRIGVEDPRTAGIIRAVASWTGDAALSTSGDYQQYFERDGVRYHHVIDPATGLSVPGVRSLTILGRFSGLESDVLSTALMVRGPARATAYARDGGLGLFVIDEVGDDTLVEPASDEGISLAAE